MDAPRSRPAVFGLEGFALLADDVREGRRLDVLVRLFHAALSMYFQAVLKNTRLRNTAGLISRVLRKTL